MTETRDLAAELNAEFDAWFAQLQALSNVRLIPEHWTDRWFDGYSPAEALSEGPDEEP